MSLIEGVGDEVTDFFIIMSVLLVGWLAWCSTSIADQPLIRTVLILRDRTPLRVMSLRANQSPNPERVLELDPTEEEVIETLSPHSDNIQLQCSNESTTGDYLLSFYITFFSTLYAFNTDG